jgi:hypothetical protein
MQRLPNGNTLIGWGRSISIPVFSEFDAEGNKILEFYTEPGHGSYRVFRFPWNGYPTWPPRLLAEEEAGRVKLYFSWNGSTETAAYQIYGGQDRANLSYLGTVDRDGFETRYEYEPTRNGLWYFQVVPVDGDGSEGLRSNLAPVSIGWEPLYLPLVATEGGS